MNYELPTNTKSFDNYQISLQCQMVLNEGTDATITEIYLGKALRIKGRREIRKHYTLIDELTAMKPRLEQKNLNG